MAKKKAAARKAPAKRPRNGAQQQLAGMEEKISKRLMLALEVERDTKAEKATTDAARKLAKQELIEAMKADGRLKVRCPFTDLPLELGTNDVVRVVRDEQPDEGV